MFVINNGINKQNNEYEVTSREFKRKVADSCKGKNMLS